MIFQYLLKDETALNSHSFQYPAHTITFPFLIPEPAPTISYRENKFPSKIVAKVPTIVPRNPLSYFFALFLIASVTPFGKISESSRVWTIFIMSFISSFEIIKVVAHEADDKERTEPCIFL